jgi:CRISPR-associated protein Cas5t
MKLLYIRLEGWTATFRLPLIYSGTGLTAPMPPYSTLLGLIGNLAARQMTPSETRIGYIFRSEGTSYDLETTRRLEMGKDGRLKSQIVPGIVKRQFHVRPSIDLFLDNLSLLSAFESPANVPCLGRSQDLAWITKIKEVDAKPRETGILRGTLIPFPQPGATGVILPLPDYINNDQTGFTREVGRVSKFQAVRYETPVQVTRPDLFQVDVEGMATDEVVYLRSLLS